MEYKGKIISNPARFTRVLGVGVGVVLFVFEVIICAQYVSLKPMPAVWKIVGGIDAIETRSLTGKRRGGRGRSFAG